MRNVLVLVVLCLLPLTVAAQEGDIRVIIRGDDLGSTEGTLESFELAFNNGILTSGGIIVAAPWFEGAAELAKKNPHWCVGVHFALVGEWRGYRWRPVLPYDEVSSIVDGDGFLYTYPEELWAQEPDIEEIEAELRAQVALAKKKGVRVQYLDTHYMGSDDYPGLQEVITRIAEEHDLPVSGTFGEQRMSIYTTPIEEKTETLVQTLSEIGPGLHILVCHPGIDSAEHNALIHSRPDHIFTNGGVGPHRAAVTEALTSLEVKSMILSRGIELISYRDLWEEMGHSYEW